MNLHSMEALLAVSELKTLGAAARQLDVPRALVRRRLDALEADVGTTLTYRGRGLIRLTPAGRLLAERAKGLMQAVTLAVQDTREAAKKPDGVVRFVGPIGAPVDIRSQVLIELGRQHPDLRFEVVDTEDPLAHIDGEFDLLTYFGRPLEDPLFIVRPLVHFRVGLMATPAYLEAHGCPETIEALRQHRLLAWRPSQNAFKGLPGPDEQLYAMRPALESADMELVREMASRGAGIAWCSVVELGAADAQRDLVPVMADRVTTTMSGWLVCPLPSTMKPQNRAILEGILHSLQPVALG